MKTLIAKDGYVFANKDKSELRSTYMIVPNDFDDYVEVTEAEAETIKKEIEKKQEEMYKGL